MAFIQFQFRRGTSTEWTTANPVLASAEIGIETDTKLFKIGDGTTSWTGLSYAGLIGASGYSGYSGISGYSGAQFVGSSGYSGFSGMSGAPGMGFAIAKTYSSVAALTADTSPSGITTGQFAIIDTGNVQDPENSRLYLWNGTSYQYTSDLSGAQGIKGESGISGYSGFSGFSGSAGPSTAINATDSAAASALYPVMVSASGSNQTPTITSNKFSFNATTGTLSVTGNMQIDGGTSIEQIQETVNTKTGSTGTVVHDWATGAIFYHSSISANFTANFTNVPTTADKAYGITLILNQGATGRYPSAVQVNGNAVTLRWSNNVVPTPSTNKIDTCSFTLIYTGSTWFVLGQYSTFA